MFKTNIQSACLAGLACTLLVSCSLEERMRMNQIQVLGSHNSYHIQPRPALLAALGSFDPALATSLEYTHLPILEQLDRGVRQLEIDVFADPQGGRYARRAGLLAVGQKPESGIAALHEPGLKVLHVQDIDFETHCLTFRSCLAVLEAWSEANPTHLPVMVMIETKQEAIPDPLGLGFVIPLPFGVAELDGVDAEIRSIFAPDQLITPDDVRGDEQTLEQAVLRRGWPTLAEARGRILFTLLHGGSIREQYVAGHPSLAGRVMFVNSEVGRPDAAFFNRDSALEDGPEILDLVRAGYLVRTRADIDTLQARTGDTTLQQAAFASGGQFISTDYLVPDPTFGTGYTAQIPGGFIARCNPITAPRGCDSFRLSDLDGGL